MATKKIGFIGTGVMGSSIVKHLLNAGHEVTIYTRTKSKADALISLGATWAETPAQASKDQHIIFTMVGYPKDVEEQEESQPEQNFKKNEKSKTKEARHSAGSCFR